MDSYPLKRAVLRETESNQTPLLRATRLFQRLLRRASGKTIYIYGKPYLTRYYLLGDGSGKGPEVYVHHMHQIDDFRWLHNHPWCWFLSIMLAGSYLQETFNRKSRREKTVHIRRFNLFRGFNLYHAIRELPQGEAWTFVVVPPKTRTYEWGYWDPQSNLHVEDAKIGHESAQIKTFGSKILKD